MKKSKTVPLLLLGSTALLASCTPDQQPIQEMRQDAYASIEACDRDWVDDVCERSSGGSGLYLGPRYFYSHDTHTPYVIDRQGRTRPMPRHYGAYNGYGAGANAHIAGTPAVSPERTTIVTRNASAHGSSSISRGGFGGGRGSFSFGG
ncbi:MAG TPA: hypothetical protein VF663_04875 [Telluria sp.]|jgi:hypothetical protein